MYMYMYVYIYLYTYLYVNIYLYVYIYMYIKKNSAWCCADVCRESESLMQLYCKVSHKHSHT